MEKSIKYSMNGQQMRIGNNVYNRNKRIIYVHPSDIDLQYYWGVTNFGRFPPYRGIPVDDEMLRRLSFELEPETKTMFLTEYRVFNITTGDYSFTIYQEIGTQKYSLYRNWGDHQCYHLKDVVFVHDVQNMVYDITDYMLMMRK